MSYYRYITWTSGVFIAITKNERAAMYGDKLQEEVCELLGGSVDEETLPPAPAPSSNSRPTISSTPPPAPIISPTMPPTPAPSSSPPPPPSSKRPTSPPSGGGVGGSAKKYTTPSINKARDHAKGVMFQVSAKSNISITGLDIMGKDAKKSDVRVYYQNGSYDKFDALDKGEWVEVFKGNVMLDPDELVNIELDKDMMIRAGGTASLYVVSKKGVLFTKSSDKEFGIYGENTDFYIQVGTSTKKEFQKPDKLAEFAGRIVYQK